MDIQDTKNQLETDFQEMELLEQLELIQRYKRLAKLKYEICHGLNLKTEEARFNHEYYKYTQGAIQETNKIYCFQGEYDAEEYYQEPQTTPHKVAVYIDIENEKRKIIIDSTSRPEFESSNHVIIPETTGLSSNWLAYVKIREKFFLDCIKYGQEEAVQKILDINNQKNPQTKVRKKQKNSD